MKKLAIRLGLLLALLVAFILDPFHGQVGVLLWGTITASVFAFAVIFLAGRAPIFIVTALIAVTVAFPLVILCAIGLPAYGSWSKSAAQLVHNMRVYDPYHGLYMLVPTFVAIVLMSLIGRYISPNNSVRDFQSTPRA
jgi:hypothetical protein